MLKFVPTMVSRRLRRLEALLCVADTQRSFIISGNGDVIAPDDGVLAIGSGGSFSAAQFAAALHQKHCGQIAKAMTPLEATTFTFGRASMTALLLSASGGNPDILDAFKKIVVKEPAHLGVLAGSSASELAHRAANFRYVEYCELSPPSGRDGFLATNSLLAFSVALTRAYAHSGSTSHPPPDLFELIGGRRTLKRWRGLCDPLWAREHLVVLFPPLLQAAAADLESKFTEAAIGSVQIADYRQFAHGRHHWLAKRGEKTGVLAFITPQIAALANRTLELLPKSIPVAKIDFTQTGDGSALAAIAAAIIITGFAGEARAIDPGRPGVPAFGRRIYHLKARCVDLPRSEERRTQIILRKSNDRAHTLASAWTRRLADFARNLSRAQFRAVVFDYDGTLCDASERFTGICDDVAGNLRNLLENDIPVGIATGRGKSVRRNLRGVLQRQLWSHVVIGYYNGFETASLNEDRAPHQRRPSPEMQRLAAHLSEHPFISKNATCDVRAGQISLTPGPAVPLEVLWQVVAGVVHEQKFNVVMSSHAVDVIPCEVSKLAVIDKIRELFSIQKTYPILCIGDRGRPPGNDSLLLAEPHSLSVDEVSADPQVCWNLALPGHRGVQALLDYFKAFRIMRGGFRVAASALLGNTE